MINIDHRKVKNALYERFGITLNIKMTAGKLKLRLTDLGYGEGFTLIMKSEWRYLSVEFVHDSFSGPLLKTMERSSVVKKKLFTSLFSNYCSLYNEVEMKINGVIVNPAIEDVWINKWSNLTVKMNRFPIIQEDMESHLYEKMVIQMFGDLLNLILVLLPKEEGIEEDFSTKGLPEGALTKIEVNRYERSLINRQNCLLLKGYLCEVCNFDFEAMYGSIGKGYIHVHHIVPVSKIGQDYEINPETDLVPLCPNCHSMIHKRNPPYSIEELKKTILIEF